MTGKFVGLAAATLLAACTTLPSTTPKTAATAAACPAGSAQMAKAELYFGLAIPGGGQVSAAEWQAFLDAEITGRFPDGLSVDEVSGQWRDAATGKAVKEPSRVVMIFYASSAQSETAIEAIRTAYKTRFRQDSVMRVDEVECVGF
jgi:uncharacterized membrane protein